MAPDRDLTPGLTDQRDHVDQSVPRDESDPFASLPDRTRLHGDDGRLLLVFSLAASTRDDRPWADCAWRPASAPVERTCSAVLDGLAGYALSTTDQALAEALCRAGAAELRHAHVMSHSLSPLPAVETDSRIQVEPLSAAQLSRHAPRLAAVSHAAYPVGHADHEHGAVSDAANELLAIARGELLGPYLDSSRVALVGGEVVGACLLVDREGTPPDGGPWVIDVFRDPACVVRGIGSALLVGALTAAASARADAVSLVVSHTNQGARRVYESLGFVAAAESWTLALPS